MPDRFVTLISGATRGIGLACAERLHHAGHHIVGLARSAPEQVFPGDFFAVDFTDRSASADVLQSLHGQFEFTGLVNNVGTVGPQLIEDVTLDVLDEVMQVNLGAAVLCVQACLPGMRRAGFGRIVTISSELALGLPTRTAYGGAKAALLSATRTWAMELAADGITANAIAPGPVNTGLFTRNNPPGSGERARKLAKIPLGRFGEPHDVANAVAFFMAPETGYVTGQTLFVDGGSSLGVRSLI